VGRAPGSTTCAAAWAWMGFAREVCDRVLFMDAGVVVEQGAPRQVLPAPREERTRRFLSRVL